MTDAFVEQIYKFSLRMKESPSMDKKVEYGNMLVQLLRRQFAKMALTKYDDTDLRELLQALPGFFQEGRHQDVTEAIRFIFEKLGGSQETLLKYIFAGEIETTIQCLQCQKTRSRTDTFTDLVVTVPPNETGSVPNMQKLVEEEWKCEMLGDPLTCESCEMKTPSQKWSKMTAPPTHLLVCFNRLSFNTSSSTAIKQHTPVNVLESLTVGGCRYKPYHVIFHRGKDASMGHYYAVGKRSEGATGAASSDSKWYKMDDSDIEPADVSLLEGNLPMLEDDAACVVFLRRQQAPATPEVRVPSLLVDFVRREDEKRARWGSNEAGLVKTARSRRSFRPKRRCFTSCL